MAKFNRFRNSSATQHEYFDGSHRFEHWYRDNTVCFITARCREVRAGLVTDYRDYSLTIVNVGIDRAIRRAVELNAFMEDVPYAPV